MLLASLELFGDGTVDPPVGGSWYSAGYQRFEFFAQRAQWIHATAPPGKILVTGCAWGYLVDELLKLRPDQVWGMDASSWAVGMAAQKLPAISSRILSGSVLVRQDMNAARAAAGITGNGVFSWVVTEDMLTALTQVEVNSALGELRRVSGQVAHIVTPGVNTTEPLPGRDNLLNWRSLEEWAAVPTIDQFNQPVYSAETGAVINQP